MQDGPGRQQPQQPGPVFFQDVIISCPGLLRSAPAAIVFYYSPFKSAPQGAPFFMHQDTPSYYDKKGCDGRREKKAGVYAFFSGFLRIKIKLDKLIKMRYDRIPKKAATGTRRYTVYDVGNHLLRCR